MPRPGVLVPEPGDWFCESCGDHQFKKNTVCRRCGQAAPPGHGGLAGGGLPLPTAAARGETVQRDGDWFCGQCGDMQFAKNMTCRKCGAVRPASAKGGTPGCRWCKMGDCYEHGVVGQTGNEMFDMMSMMFTMMTQGKSKDSIMNLMAGGSGKGAGKGAADGKGKQKPKNMEPGDWFCPVCGDMQFKKNITCRKCQTPNPNIKEGGDWVCPGCGDFQFKRNEKCRMCETPNPHPLPEVVPLSHPRVVSSQPMEEGDWICEACGDHQFKRNTACRKCGTPKPGLEDEGGLTGLNAFKNFNEIVIESQRSAPY